LFAMKDSTIFIRFFPHRYFWGPQDTIIRDRYWYFKGELVYFSSGNLSQSLMASSCIPMLFQPVQYKNTLFVDGGYSIISYRTFIRAMWHHYRQLCQFNWNEVDQVHMNNVMVDVFI
jgi:NTE family protein